jgi:hypothetical protein
VRHVAARVFYQRSKNFDTAILSCEKGCSLVEFVLEVGVNSAHEQVLNNTDFVPPCCVVQQAILEDVLKMDCVLWRLHEFDNVYQVILRCKLHNLACTFPLTVDTPQPQQPFTFNARATLLVFALNSLDLLLQYLLFRLLHDLFFQSPTEHPTCNQ